MHGVLDGICDQVGDMLWVDICLNSEKDLLVGIFNAGDSLVPISITLLDHAFSVFFHLDKSLCLLWGRRNLADVNNITSFSIDSSVRKSIDAYLLRLFKHAHERWLNLHRLEQVNLLLSLREPIKDPSVHSAVSLPQSLFN